MGFLDEAKYIETGTTVSYEGYAWPGTSTSDKKWKLKRITISGNLTKTEYALPSRGSNTVTDYYIFKWDDRASTGITYG